MGKIEMMSYDGKRWEKQGNYTGSVQLGWEAFGMPEKEKTKLQNAKKRLGRYRIDKSGALIDYRQIKMSTGIFILPDCWDSKRQLATGVYEPLNRIINQWLHVITLTYDELIQRTDFDSTKLVSEIRTRMSKGVPIHLTIPAMASPMQVISHVAKSMDGKLGPELNNPNGVPTDLRQFIPYYNIHKLDDKN
ncbi:MAG: hypothetical protein IPP71_19705 [Bacteroidetes bacterium]|nr:hypothetical protein [Bacteroidota bacterium]